MLSHIFRQKAARLLAAKTTLASRVDFIHESSDGSIGKSLFEQIKQKIEKMLEPPPVKAAKPLPKPLDKVNIVYRACSCILMKKLDNLT